MVNYVKQGNLNSDIKFPNPETQYEIDMQHALRDYFHQIHSILTNTGEIAVVTDFGSATVKTTGNLECTTLKASSNVEATAAVKGASAEITGEIDMTTLDVSGNGDIDGTLAVGGTLTAEGALNVTGNLDVDGDTILDNLTVDGVVVMLGTPASKAKDTVHQAETDGILVYVVLFNGAGGSATIKAENANPPTVTVSWHELINADLTDSASRYNTLTVPIKKDWCYKCEDTGDCSPYSITWYPIG